MKTRSRFRSGPALFSAALLAIGLPVVSAAPTKIVTGPDEGLTSQTNTYSPTGNSTGTFLAYGSFTGGVRVAMADVRGTNDIITGTGPGSGPHVKVFSGPDHTEVYSFIAFPEPNYDHGIFVAGGDINGDGSADIIVGPGDGSGSRTRVPPPPLKVFSGADGTTLLRNFYVFGPGYSGGGRGAAGIGRASWR